MKKRILLFTTFSLFAIYYPGSALLLADLRHNEVPLKNNLFNNTSKYDLFGDKRINKSGYNSVDQGINTNNLNTNYQILGNEKRGETHSEIFPSKSPNLNYISSGNNQQRGNLNEQVFSSSLSPALWINEKKYESDYSLSYSRLTTINEDIHHHYAGDNADSYNISNITSDDVLFSPFSATMTICPACGKTTFNTETKMCENYEENCGYTRFTALATGSIGNGIKVLLGFTLLYILWYAFKRRKVLFFK
ncbi:hypothetical protein LJB95_02275 [Paludibacteraceae bacterium OttesenSCG-928-F17]|nr:hypothetical protein [Paludibacteraceae bacterium OttesenSCG-928-F17]